MKVLAIIDMQKDFIDGALGTKEAVAIVPKVAARLAQARADGETVVFVCHPGYLDRFILESSSLTTDRTKEVDALIDPELRAWLEAQDDLRLIDYRDL